eukprot:2790494-Pyramimonas_sp.AAC.1
MRQTISDHKLYVEPTFYEEASGHTYISSAGTLHKNDHVIANDVFHDTYTDTADHLPAMATFKHTIVRKTENGASTTSIRSS